MPTRTTHSTRQQNSTQLSTRKQNTTWPNATQHNTSQHDTTQQHSTRISKRAEPCCTNEQATLKDKGTKHEYGIGQAFLLRISVGTNPRLPMNHARQSGQLETPPLDTSKAAYAQKCRNATGRS